MFRRLVSGTLLLAALVVAPMTGSLSSASAAPAPGPLDPWAPTPVAANTFLSQWQGSGGPHMGGAFTSCVSADFCAVAGYMLGPGSNSNEGFAGIVRNGVLESTMVIPKLVGPDGSTAVASQFDDVDCPTETFCVAVGAAPATAPANGTLVPAIEIYDGAGWTSVPPPPNTTNLAVSHISCTSPTFCLAIGAQYSPQGPAALVMRNGAWSRIAVPVSTSQFFTDVSCASATYCAVLLNEGTHPFVFDGSSLTVDPRTLPDQANGNDISHGYSRVSCYGEDECLYGGALYTSGSSDLPVFAQSDGSGWKVSVGHGGDIFSDVACRSQDDCFSVADANPGTILNHYDGTSWTRVKVAGPFGDAGSDARAGAVIYLDCSDSGFCSATGSEYVVATVTLTPAIYTPQKPTGVTAAGSQGHGSYSPTFTLQSQTDTAGVSATGAVTCTTVDGGTPIGPDLAIGSHQLDPTGCTGAVLSDDRHFASYSGSFVVGASAAAPDAPELVTHDPANGQPFECCGSGVTVRWKPVLAPHDGGDAVTGYTVTRVSPLGIRTDFPVATNLFGNAYLQLLDGDVTDPTGYTYEVRATNHLGSSDATVYTPAELGAPGPVRNLAGAGTGGRVVISWQAPEQTRGPLLQYDIYRLDLYTGDAPTTVVGPDQLSYTDTNVQAGHSYTYYVMAHNVAGFDPLSSNHYDDYRFVDVTVTGSSNTAPVAPDSSRSVRGDQASGVTLSGSDVDGDALVYSVATGPGHGALSGAAPSLTYTPTAGYTGPDSFTYTVDDGNGGTATGTVTLTVTAPDTGAVSVSQPVTAGQSVETGTALTADEPAQAGVTTPVAGSITITQDPSIADPAGYVVVGAQYLIEAPQASAAVPLSLVFQVDASTLPTGEDENSVTVFRDGVPIVACDDQSGSATPDPCVLSRTSSGGVVTITVLSSHASQWTLGVAKKATVTTVLPVAVSTYGQPVTLKATVVQDGAIKPIGTVQFKDGTTVLGSVAVSNGTATLPNLVLSAGTHQVTAVYSGSGTSSPSTSAAVAVKVAKAPVVVTTSSSSGLVSLLTFKVNYTSVVKSAVTGLPVAGESVTTRVTGGSVNTGCTAVTNAQGVATCSAGPIQISIATPYTAVAAESANYLAGTGNAITKLF